MRAPWRSRVRRSLQVQKIDLDPLADRREVRALAGLVFAAGTEDRGVQVADGLGGELAAGVALVADQGHSPPWRRARPAGSVRPRARRVWGSTAPARGGCRPARRSRAAGTPRRTGNGWRSSHSRARDRAEAGGPARLTVSRLRAHSTGVRVDQQQIVLEPRALAGEHAHQPLQASPPAGGGA